MSLIGEEELDPRHPCRSAIFYNDGVPDDAIRGRQKLLTPRRVVPIHYKHVFRRFAQDAQAWGPKRVRNSDRGPSRSSFSRATGSTLGGGG